MNAAECASLAAITKAPSTYDPLNDPKANKKRQEYFLEAMYKEGSISKDEYESAKSYKLVFTNSKEYKGSKVKAKSTKKAQTVNSYYVDHVITSVIEDLQKNGYTYKKAKNMVYGGGLQKALENVYENYKRMPDETVQGAMVVMDYNGRVLGLVGGTGKKKVNLGLNRATMSKRQPGSTIKPLSVYGPALEKSLQDENTNIYWSTMIKDAPLKVVDMISDAGAVDYSLDFISNRFHISTLDSVKDCDYAPMATGGVTNGVTVLEMTAAYATFGNGGYYYEPYCYTKIEDVQGNVVLQKQPEKTKESALSENTAWVMNKLLQTVMTAGTGTSYKLSGIQCFG